MCGVVVTYGEAVVWMAHTTPDAISSKCDGKADSQPFFGHDVLLSIINPWNGQTMMA